MRSAEITPQFRDELSGTGLWEHLPREVITGVEVNEQMQAGMIEGKWKMLLSDKEELIKKAGFFAVGRKERGIQDSKDTVKLTQSPEMHRGVNLSVTGPVYDEWADCLGELNVKGSGLTYRALTFMHELSWYPLGFFGARHARQDMEISNHLAELGGRTSRGVAILLIDHDRFRQWYAGLNLTAEEKSRYNPLTNLDIVEKNNDQACLYLRLLGCERITEFQTNARNSWADVNIGPYSFDRMLKRAANLLIAERNLLGMDTFALRYPLDRLEEKVKKLEDLAKGEGIINSDPLWPFRVYSFYFTHTSCDLVSRLHYGGQLMLDTASRQIDLTGRFNDWECSLPESGQYLRQNDSQTLDGYNYLKLDHGISELQYIARLATRHGFDERYIAVLQAARRKALSGFQLPVRNSITSPSLTS